MLTEKQMRSIINKFKRNCRCTSFMGRRVKAWRVPGTSESGTLNMYQLSLRDIIKREKRETFYKLVFADTFNQS